MYTTAKSCDNQPREICQQCHMLDNITTNCTGYYLETSGVLLFAWNMLPQGQVITNLPSSWWKGCSFFVNRQACIVARVV